LAEQNINLPGIRIETLYSTIEKGIDESGNEYEKKQAIAPRTYEEAITDQNKVSLSSKISDILEKISQLDGGEYDTLLEEIEGIKEELAGLDLEKWDYIIPDTQQITFLNPSGGALHMGTNSFNNWVLERNSRAVIYVDSNNESHYTTPVNLENDVHITGFTKMRNLQIPTDHGIFIGSDIRKDSYLLSISADNDLYLQYYTTDGVPQNLFVCTPNYPQFQNGLSVSEITDRTTFKGLGGVQFTPGYNNPNSHKIVQLNQTGSLHFVTSGNPFKGFVTNATIGLNGVWTFAKPIVAPNLASTTELMSLGRQITEQDIITIETQQSVTEQDINNIETQQTLTDMELIMIGGQVA